MDDITTCQFCGDDINDLSHSTADESVHITADMFNVGRSFTWFEEQLPGLADDAAGHFCDVECLSRWVLEKVAA